MLRPIFSNVTTPLRELPSMVFWRTDEIAPVILLTSTTSAVRRVSSKTAFASMALHHLRDHPNARVNSGGKTKEFCILHTSSFPSLLVASEGKAKAETVTSAMCPCATPVPLAADA